MLSPLATCRYSLPLPVSEFWQMPKTPIRGSLSGGLEDPLWGISRFHIAYTFFVFGLSGMATISSNSGRRFSHIKQNRVPTPFWGSKCKKSVRANEKSHNRLVKTFHRTSQGLSKTEKIFHFRSSVCLKKGVKVGPIGPCSTKLVSSKSTKFGTMVVGDVP